MFLKVWDYVLGVICVLEVGGQVVDLEGIVLVDSIGNSKDVFIVKGGGIFVSNKNFYYFLVDIWSQIVVVGQ